MILALLKRRLWLWQNRLIPSLGLILILPVFIFTMVDLSLKNILIRSLSGVPFDRWVFPGLVFIIASIGLFPLLYRDFFDLRIHRKLLINVALAPYSKRTLITGYLVVAGIEAIIIGMVSTVIYSGLIPFPLTGLQFFFMIFCLGIYLLLLGNLFISIALIVDTVTTIIFIIFMVFLLVLFGNGFIIEFGFFPQAIEMILKWQPLSIPYQSLQLFLSNGIVDWTLISFSIVLGWGWMVLNSMILKGRLRQ